MNALCDWIASLASELHPSKLEALGNALLNSHEESPFVALRQCSSASIPSAAATHGLNALLSSPTVTKNELSSMFRAAAATARLLNSRVDLKLVWSGPSTSFIAVRRTEQVVVEIIESAQKELFLISYVFFSVPSVAAALQNAVLRGVKIRALFDRSEEFGGTLKLEDPVNNARRVVPSIDFYTWRCGEAGQYPGCMHVKCAIADRSIAFITSANLTGAAMEKNMELGILIKGGHVPANLDAHFSALINTRQVQPV